jgi:alkylhydroperoxidase family enzyme
VDINAFLGQEKGLDHGKLTAVANWRASAAFTGIERDVLELADAMAATPSDVEEALFRRLLDALGKQGLVELTTAIGWENFRARTNRVFDAQSENYSDGAVCMIPQPTRS